MRANLSLILDKEGEVRLDLLSGKELEEIDAYTSSKQNHHEVRDDFRPEINLFLEKNKDFIATFKREANKKGNVVITFNDEHNKTRKMRVLYQENLEKTDYDKQLANVIKTLKSFGSLDVTVEIMEKFGHLIFASDFDRQAIYYTKRNTTDYKNHQKIDKQLLDKSNQRLIKHIKDKFVGYERSTDNQKHIGYYYLRLLDAHIEKAYNVKTSASTIKTKAGVVHAKKEEIPIVKTIVVRENIPFQDQILKEEEDGQFSLFSDYQDEVNNSNSILFYDREEPQQK